MTAGQIDGQQLSGRDDWICCLFRQNLEIGNYSAIYENLRSSKAGCCLERDGERLVRIA
jgi:hypothetical protein